MDFIRAAIDNPVKVAVGVILVVLFGLVGLTRMPTQLGPEVEVPRVSIQTRWPGASPVEIEREIVDEQEEQLNTTEGLVKLESQSRDSVGSITLEFPVGSDIDATMLMVNNRLNQVRRYPINADQPVISKVDSANSRAIAWFMLRPRDGEADPADVAPDEVADEATGRRGIEAIEKERTFAEDEVEAELEKVPGVAAANTFGGREKRLEVIVDPHQIAAREITIGQLRDALVGRNKDTSGGDFWEGKRRYVLRTLGQFRSPEQVENVIIVRREGRPVYVKDVATVRIGYKKPESLVRQRGQTTIAMNVQRATGANVLEVMTGLKEKVKELNAGILKDRGLEIEQVYDETEYIEGAIWLVETNIVIAGVLTVLVLLLFLRSGWPTLVIALAIPTSIVGTFFLFASFGRTLNVISLAGMAFAVGMVVDNAIVVMESIYRHFEMGKPRMQAAYDGAKEVWGAVLASTLTTLAVFLPVVFIQEEAGQLFRDIAIAISCAVGLSLIVAMTVIPCASARILRRGKGAGFEGSQRGALGRVTSAVVGLNARIQRSITARLATVIACVVAAVVGSFALWPSVEYLPEGNRNLIIGLLLPPPGYNLDEMIRIGEKVEDHLSPYWQTDSQAARERGVPGIEHFFFVASGRRLFMGAKSTDAQRAAELIPVLREAVGGIPGMIPVVLQTSLFEGALSGGRSIDIEITGDRLEKLVQLGGQVFGQTMAMSKDPSNPLAKSQIRPVPSLDIANPEVHVTPKWEQVADLGISAQDLGYVIDALVDGAYAGDYYDQNDKIDLEIVGAERYARRTQQLEQLYLAATGGQLVPLSAVADVELSVGPEQINHRDRRRTITIAVTPDIKTPLEIARRTIEEQIIGPIRDAGQLEGGRYRIVTAGTADKLTQAWGALGFNLLLAVFITYLLMAGLFESFLYPFVIMVSVPLAAVGGFAGLFVTNLATQSFLGRVSSLDILTMLGFVILIGTVVNNPILIVHQALNLIRGQGMTPRQAVLESTRTRVRPIFMSTGTTVLGLLPLVIMPGSGSEIYRGLGSVVLGGLIVSTLFSLVLVPTLFTLMLEAKGLLVRQLGWESTEKAAVPATETGSGPTSRFVATLQRRIQQATASTGTEPKDADGATTTDDGIPNVGS